MLNSITDLIAIFIDQTLLVAIIISIFCAIMQGYSGFGGGLVFVPLVASLYNPHSCNFNIICWCTNYSQFPYSKHNKGNK